MIDEDRKDLAEFLAGKPQGARALVGRYAQALVNHASYMLSGDRALAEDVVQNSFLKLWQNAAKLMESDRELQLRAWLYRVVRNNCLDEMKRSPHADIDEAYGISDGSLAAHEGMEHEDRAKYVMGLVARLPERQKSALLMSHFEGMGNVEISQVLDCTVEAVENLLSRARRSLRAWAEEEEVVI